MTNERPAISSHLHPTPSWRLEDHDIPTGREETWRFSPVAAFKTIMAPAQPYDWATELPDSVKRSVIDAERAKEISFDPPVDIVSASAVAGAGDHVVLVEIPAEVHIDTPIVFGVDADIEASGHLLVTVGHHAKVTLVWRHLGNAKFASKVEVHAAEGAHVDICSLQDWSEEAVHGSQFSVKIGRDAKVRTIQASIGKGNVRMVERAEYDGTGGDLEQLGMYFVQSGQHVEHRLFVDHNAPHTDSHVDYRGALQGKGAHSVWIGDVLIRAAGKDIETFETNKNLMLTEGCQADSVPNLEIETGEIRGAGHSSSTGRFDESQLFYLRSRGIPEDQARRLIVEGFFLDIIHRIGISEIEQRLINALNEQLDAVEGIASAEAK